MTIDSPYTCCWGWALVFAHRAVFGRSSWAWEATGLMVGLGILAKYTMAVFVPSLALFLLTSREHRRLLFSAGFWSMVGITTLCGLPILIWNAQHDWVTLYHVLRLAGLAGEGTPLRTGTGLRWWGPLSYVGMQAAILMGYWFVAWLCAMIAHNPLRERDAGVRYLWWLSAPMFLVFLGFSLKTGGGEPNWPVTAYLSGGVLAAGWLARQLQSPSCVLPPQRRPGRRPDVPDRSGRHCRHAPHRTDPSAAGAPGRARRPRSIPFPLADSIPPAGCAAGAPPWPARSTACARSWRRRGRADPGGLQLERARRAGRLLRRASAGLLGRSDPGRPAQPVRLLDQPHRPPRGVSRAGRS